MVWGLVPVPKTVFIFNKKMPKLFTGSGPGHSSLLPSESFNHDFTYWHCGLKKFELVSCGETISVGRSRISFHHPHSACKNSCLLWLGDLIR